jgi:zinc protease
VGAAHENYGETGMAHLLEHLVFKGTPSRGNIMQELGRRGMSYNGSTGWDRTNYFESFTASNESLEWALQMEADRMVNSFIRRSDLDSEMTVVRNEFENGENNPQLVLFGKMLSTAFQWHNYGHLPIGARTDIENVDIGRLQAFYKLYYQPDNAVLIVAGKFDPDPALALIAKYFGPIPKPARALPVIYTQDPVQDGERSATLRRSGNSQFLGMMFHTVRGAHPDYVASDTLGDIMTLAPSGRMYKSLVETKKASSVQAWNEAQVDPGTLTFFAQIPDGQSVEAAREAMLATIANVAKEPITEAEVARVRARAAKYFDETMANPEKFGVSISESVALGDWRLFFVQRDRYRTLKPEDVQRVALDYLKRSNLTIGEFLPDAKPDRAPVPATVDVAAMVKDYKGDAAAMTGEVFDPTPANLDARTQRFTLPNGMKVALLPKKTRGETGELQPVAPLRRREVRVRQGIDRRACERHAHAGHRQAFAPGDRRHVRQAARESRRDGLADCGRRERSNLPRAIARRAQADGGGAARAQLPGDRARPAQAGAIHVARGLAHRSAGDRFARAVAARQPVSRRRPALLADDRGEHRQQQRRDARRRQAVPPRVLRGVQRRAVDRR